MLRYKILFCSHAKGDPVFARDSNAEFRRKAVMESDEITPQLRPSIFLQARRQCLGGTVAGRDMNDLRRHPTGFVGVLAVFASERSSMPFCASSIPDHADE